MSRRCPRSLKVDLKDYVEQLQKDLSAEKSMKNDSKEEQDEPEQKSRKLATTEPEKISPALPATEEQAKKSSPKFF